MASSSPSFADLCRVFGRIGILSFGGPAAQIALMHKSLVEEQKWLTEADFLKALSFCMLLPGPEAMQLATYAGWKQRGVAGGLIGGGLFVLPGAIVISILAYLYLSFGALPVVQAVFLGIQAAVVVIVIEALIKLARRALISIRHRIIAIAAFVALYVFAVPFPLVIAVAAVVAALGSGTAQPAQTVAPVSLRKSALILLVGLIIWAMPLVVLWLQDSTFLVSLGLFFSKLAVVTFGGAYAVLAYMTQEVVVNLEWLTTEQMIDALGLAETTPGPLILVTQFVGMLAGAAQGGAQMAFVAGALTLWVTFVPCFIWIFAGAPLIDWLDGQPRLRKALAGVMAAVVGVIASLSLWFAFHVFFGTVTQFNAGPVTTFIPDVSDIHLKAVALSLVAAYLIFRRQMPLPATLAICAILGAFAGTL
ncbi:chromate efflux transporter [Yoonia litorea]|uniref:Chromate transporter n=1 Tax=Yoonia litorea TaxID=1123755 RepID=A0A1I6M7J4_9RHOB|nr:chromate efflux transporter [Yoonia litorea]SFS11679.1 chromate transporter [Yoonia litorea]